MPPGYLLWGLFQKKRSKTYFINKENVINFHEKNQFLQLILHTYVYTVCSTQAKIFQ